MRLEEIRLRKTGRTYKMIESAVDCAIEGGEVVIVMDNQRMINYIKKWNKLYSSLEPEFKKRIRFMVSRNLEFYGDFTPYVRGLSKKTLLLIDHWVLETKFRKILELWLQWND